MSSVRCFSRDCLESLELPSFNERYCPFCGVLRAFSQREHEVCRIGFDAFDPNGRVLAYRSLDCIPEPLQPGKDEGRVGPDWRDLWSSSGQDFPSRSFFFADPPGFDEVLAQESAFFEEVLRCVARHGRIYLLLKGGQIQAYDSLTKKSPAEWVYPVCCGADRTVQMHASETLLAVTSQQETHLYGLGTGEEIRVLSHGFGKPRVRVGADHVVAIGAPFGSRQEVSCHRVSDPSGEARLPSVNLRRPAEDRFLLAPYSFDGGFLFFSGDGFVHRWIPGQPVSEVAWPNPGSQSPLTPRCLDLGERGLGLLVGKPDGEASLCIFNSILSQPHLVQLPLLTGSRARLATCRGDSLYILTQPPRQPIEVYRQSLLDGETQKLTTLGATIEDTPIDLFVAPAQGRAQLILRTDHGHEAHTYLIRPETGESILAGGSPHVEESLQVLWDARVTLKVKRKQGRISQL